MREKDFESLSVQEQKEKLSDLITSWCDQDTENRSALVLLSDRKDKEDAGQTTSLLLGPGTLLLPSVGSVLERNAVFKSMILYCLITSLGESPTSLDK